MFDPKYFLQLFTDVMYGDVTNYCIRDLEVSEKLSNIVGVHSQGFGPLKVVDYNGVSNRCAYLHQYAPLHAAIVCHTMRRILAEETSLRFRLESGAFRMCSLGGGPGTDVVGVLAALDAIVGPVRHWRTAVSVVDYMEGWKPSFRSVVRELCRTDFSRRFAEDRFSWKYVQGDLLDFRRHEIWDSVTYSSLVTVVKCLSTFRSRDVTRAIRKVFRAMSYGSFILIIDDVAEELTEIIMRTADSQQLIPIFGPHRNAHYSFEELKVTRFGHSSCHQAAVTTLLLMKPLFNPKSPFTPALLSSTSRHCSKCGDKLFECSKCSLERDARNILSFLKGLFHSRQGLYGNRFRTLPSSRSISAIQFEPALPDSVVIELPE